MFKLRYKPTVPSWTKDVHRCLSVHKNINPPGPSYVHMPNITNYGWNPCSVFNSLLLETEKCLLSHCQDSHFISMKGEVKFLWHILTIFFRTYSMPIKQLFCCINYLRPKFSSENLWNKLGFFKTFSGPHPEYQMFSPYTWENMAAVSGAVYYLTM